MRSFDRHRTHEAPVSGGARGAERVDSPKTAGGRASILSVAGYGSRLPYQGQIMATTPASQIAKSDATGVAHAVADADTLSRLEKNIDAVPIVLGVTGHRDLRPQDVPALAIEVRR